MSTTFTTVGVESIIVWFLSRLVPACLLPFDPDSVTALEQGETGGGLEGQWGLLDSPVTGLYGGLEGLH